jgi:hypothetical protein
MLIGQVRMHTVVVFFSILGGIAYFGILGMFIGPLVLCKVKRKDQMKLAALITMIMATAGLLMGVSYSSSGSSIARDDNAARATFMQAYKVFMSPRCMNCHPAGNTPLQGDDSRPHFDHVLRGEDGNGVYALRCSNCHQAANRTGLNMPPGAPSVLSDGSVDSTTPRWHLPSMKTPMIFQGRSAAQLCRQLQDTKQNGGLTTTQFLHHVSNDPLVLWAWNPGEGRKLPPVTHDEFVSSVKGWLDNGGACPK